ncbi:glycosyltransferase [Burkholderia sp. WAC0059]|nr:glycosyltransferase [Burkholderia sp. WAC0059]
MRTAAGTPSAVVQAAMVDGLRRARDLLGRRQYREAQALYEGVLLMDASNAEAMHLLGFALLKAGDPVRAEPLIARSLELGWTHAWNIANHGAVLIALERYQEALDVLARALLLEPASLSTQTLRADALVGIGRREEALEIYDQILARMPTIADAWMGRGRLLVASGRPADAVLCFDRVLQLDAGSVDAYVRRGHALRDLGYREDALRNYRLALVIRPKSPDLLSMCAGVLLDMQQPAEALACVEQALAVSPDSVALLYQSCVALDLLHFHEELLQRSSRLLKLAPQYVAVWLARGNALQGLSRYAEAADAYREAMVRDPHSVDALRNRAGALRMMGLHAQALEHYDSALTVAGADAELLYNRAVALQQLGRYDEALDSYGTAVEAPKETAQACYTAAVSLQQLGRHEEAISWFEQAYTLEPGHGAARRSAALCRLLTGDFRRGWKQHEDRWLTGEARVRRRHTDRPIWNGIESVAGKTILLHAEQGYGDTIQFCRYASLVADRGATVVLEIPAVLKPVLRSLRGVQQIVSEGEPVPPFDLQCPLMSLPLAFDTALDSIPSPVPYLYADQSRVRGWAGRLQALSAGRLKIGLAWSGNPRHNNDENRSIPLAELAPVYGLNATFVSLQPLVRERDAAMLAASGILDWGRELGDFADTAGLISALDLVITVDTSVAHLAGALGQPVWLLLPCVPDWRWLLDREDSPWYPTMKLYRQGRPGDWPSLVQRVAQSLISRMLDDPSQTPAG